MKTNLKNLVFAIVVMLFSFSFVSAVCTISQGCTGASTAPVALFNLGALPFNGSSLGATVYPQTFTNGVQTGKIFPISDSTTALQFNKANATTTVLNIDTTNGRVGIGTTAPGDKLHVSGGNILIDNNQYLRFKNVAGTAKNTLSFDLSDNLQVGGGANDVMFYSGGSGTEAMRIKAGNVGIGTPSPTANLHIYKDTTSAMGRILLQTSTNDTATSGYQIDWATPASFVTARIESALKSANNSYLGFSTLNGSDHLKEWMRIDNYGKVGIGTTVPGARLDVSPTITTTTDLKGMLSGLVYNGATAMTDYYGYYIAAPTGTGTITNKYAFVTEANAGNVGIGTTGPTSKLHLAAGTATAGTAPLGFTSGALLNTPVVGKVEFLTDAWYGTITTGAARKTFAFLEAPTFSGNIKKSVQATIIASATSTQESGVVITADIAEIAVCGTAGDSVTLPAAVAGQEVKIINHGAESADVFPATDDVINETGANTAKALAANATMLCVAYDISNWECALLGR